MPWNVRMNAKAAKKARLLPDKAKNALHLLWKDLEERGPMQPDWPHFGKLQGRPDEWHCHLKRGRPTYVVCWKSRKYGPKERRSADEQGEIEIYYAWTHENAPYR